MTLAPKKPVRTSTPILFATGEDANPLNRRLPAEVVTRQRKVVKPAVQEEEVQVNLSTVLSLKPDARPKWLTRAFKMVEAGKASATDLYEILVTRKFALGIPPRVGSKLCAIVNEQSSIFSDKQARYLTTEEWVLSKFASQPEAGDTDDDADEPATETTYYVWTEKAEKTESVMKVFDAVKDNQAVSSSQLEKMKSEDAWFEAAVSKGYIREATCVWTEKAEKQESVTKMFDAVKDNQALSIAQLEKIKAKSGWFEAAVGKGYIREVSYYVWTEVAEKAESLMMSEAVKDNQAVSSAQLEKMKAKDAWFEAAVSTGYIREESFVKEQDTAKEKVADEDRRQRLVGLFVPIDMKQEKGQWISEDREDTRARERAREAKAKAFEGSNREQWLEGLVENAKKQEMQQQKARQRQAEQEADSSLDLLERFAQPKRQREASPNPAKFRMNASHPRKRGRSRSCSTSRDNSAPRKRGRSRSCSTSISVKAPSPSPRTKRRRERKEKRKRKESDDPLLRQRMAERDKEYDTVRVPIVSRGHAQRWT